MNHLLRYLCSTPWPLVGIMGTLGVLVASIGSYVGFPATFTLGTLGAITLLVSCTSDKQQQSMSDALRYSFRALGTFFLAVAVAVTMVTPVL